MQELRNAMASVKETAANLGASAKSGMTKTQATIQEKVERMTAHDPVEKDMATHKKDEKIREAELSKQEAREQNAASKQATSAGGTQSYTTTGGHGHDTAHMSPDSIEAHYPTEARPMTHAGHGSAHVSGGLVASQYGCDGLNTAGMHPIHGTMHPDGVIGSENLTGAHHVGHATTPGTIRDA